MGIAQRQCGKTGTVRYVCFLVVLLLTMSVIPWCASCSKGQPVTRWYGGKVAGRDGAASGSTVMCGTTRNNPVATNGDFKFEGRLGATALLRVVDSSGRTTKQAVFPKEKKVTGKSATIDFKSSAVSLVFSRPGVATTDPVAAEVITRTIERMPATEQLARSLEAKSKTEPGIVGNPDAEVLGQVSNIVGTLKGKADERTGSESGVALPPITGGAQDTSNPFFRDADGVANDGVDMRCDYKGSGTSAPFNGTNYYSRWVAVYIDPLNEKKEPVQPSEGQEDIPLVLLEPRNTELIPTVSTLVRITIVENAAGIVEDMLRDRGKPVTDQNIEDLKKELLSKTVSNARALYYPTTKDFRGDCTLDKNYMVSAYGPGLAGQWQFGKRDLVPALYTAVTKGILPLIGLALDIPDVTPLLAETPAMARLASKHQDQIQNLLQQSQSGNIDAIAYDWASFSQELLQDPEFQQVLGGAYKVGKDAIARLVAHGLVKLVPPLELYNKVANGANLAIGYVALAVTVCSLHSRDTYFFSPSGKVADLVQPAAATNSGTTSSGPIDTLKKFFAALEAGQSQTAASYLYSSGSAERTIYWGALGLTNLVGGYQFSVMDYVERSNNGANADVYVSGNMSYGDKAGITRTDCTLDGVASLAVQDGSWRIVVLPKYTQVVQPIAPPDVNLPFSVPDNLPDVPDLPFP